MAIDKACLLASETGEAKVTVTDAAVFEMVLGVCQLGVTLPSTTFERSVPLGKSTVTELMVSLLSARPPDMLYVAAELTVCGDTDKVSNALLIASAFTTPASKTTRAKTKTSPHATRGCLPHQLRTCATTVAPRIDLQWL
ncbi:MAG: hypothetical protein RQ731_04555 [Anaerosomatales bacterium]|nr:hypothetical protein [Anaerosomatales bacterium]MDT8434013.1 hypothetical protein [Anaerosomatales bacterium]